MRVDLSMVRGTTRVFDLNLENADGDLPDLGDAVVSFVVSDQFRKVCTVDESSGDATVTLDAIDTSQFPDAARVAYPYNVVVVEDDGDVHVTQRGLLIVLRSVDTPTE